MDLNDVEKTVLLDLDQNSSPDEHYIYFAGIQRRTGLSRDFVRAACRSLAAKGLAAYSSSLWTDDGDPAGSGYAVTDAGRAALAEAR